MKKTIAILLSFVMIASLAACGNAASQTEQISVEGSSVETSTGNNVNSMENSINNDASAENSTTDNIESMDASETQPEETMASEAQAPQVLVAYFSATNTTKGIAQHIANGLNADLYEIVPEDPYTDADLNYNDNNSRTTIEMNDPDVRPAISGSVENMEQYGIVFIGYPIWWGDAPRIVSTFVESYDFSGKTIVPFCTSGSSGIGSSAANLEQLTGGARWLSGQRLKGSDSQDTVMEWVNGLGLDLEGVTEGGISSNDETPDGMRAITTMELVRDMGIGINLGNTFESCGDWIAQWGDGSVRSYETAWGSPMITQEMIQGYADAGFGVLRIPVAWSNLMGEDYTISEDYMAAVKEVVDWTLDAGMYAIINIHHDNGWMADFPTDTEECMYHYSRIWEQVSDAFQNYGDHLMFESLNEEGCWDTVWNQYSGSKIGKEKVFSLLNDINQTFVDTVRSSGGNNSERHLLIAGYATNIELTSDELYHMPVDPAGRCAVSVHYYTPPVFAILEEDANWGKCRSSWGTEADFKELHKYMDMIKTNFIDQGIPVILGEYGCPKNNKEEESVRIFLTSVCREAYERQICPILWDITGLHYDRSSCKMIDTLLQEGLMENLSSNDSV